MQAECHHKWEELGPLHAKTSPGSIYIDTVHALVCESCEMFSIRRRVSCKKSGLFVMNPGSKFYNKAQRKLEDRKSLREFMSECE